jgi:hypothetical protein
MAALWPAAILFLTTHPRFGAATKYQYVAPPKDPNFKGWLMAARTLAALRELKS